MLRSGHAPGHIRDTFLEAIHAYSEWSLSDGGPLPTVTREVNYEPHQISLADACGLVWNCTDILPGTMFDIVADEDLGLAIGRRTYAAAARAMLAKLKEEGIV